MASDPVPPPDGRVIVGFVDADFHEMLWKRPAADIRAHLDTIASGPALRELLEDVRAAAPDLAVLDQRHYRESTAPAKEALIAALAEAPDAATIAGLFAEFERLYPDSVESARSEFLRQDKRARLASLGEHADIDAYVAALAQAAVDYAIPAEWWPDDCGRPPEDRERADRYAALRGDEDCESLYRYLLLDVPSAAKARAPHPPSSTTTYRYGPPSVELAEVVSLVVPTLAGVALDRLVDAAAGWLRRRRSANKQVVRIYGPGGELLREVQVTESTANNGT